MAGAAGQAGSVDFTVGRCRHTQPQGEVQSGRRPGSLALLGLPWSWMFALAALERWPWPRHHSPVARQLDPHT